MIDYSKYKQDLWGEYNSLFNRFSHQNDTYSVNVRLISLDIEQSKWDSVGGSLQYWSSDMTQLKWQVYENIPLFQNSPAITQIAAHGSTETTQNFTATMKFILTPRPNDMIMFYDDPSQTIYKINDVRFHRTIEDPLKIFECDFETAPVDAQSIYDHLVLTGHTLLDQYNYKLFDYDQWIMEYQKVIDEIEDTVIAVNGYFDQRTERYSIIEFNDLVRDIKMCSNHGAVTHFHTPITDCDDDCRHYYNVGEELDLYNRLTMLKEILC